MSLYALLLYAVTTSTAPNDSARMAYVINLNTSFIELVEAPKEPAPPCVGVQCLPQ